MRIPDEEQDKDLLDKLLAEAPGILAWAVEGCIAWQKNGLGEPAEIREATEGYRSEMDVIGHFIEDRCVLAEHAQASPTELYGAYTTWAEKSGEEPVTKTMFGRRLTERGFTSAQLGKDRARYWIGIG